MSAGISEEVRLDSVGRRPQARLAQLAERKALNLVVVGSTPTSGELCFGGRSIDFSTHLKKRAP